MKGWRVYEGDVVHDANNEKHAHQIFDGIKDGYDRNPPSYLRLVNPDGHVIEEHLP